MHLRFSLFSTFNSALICVFSALSSSNFYLNFLISSSSKFTDSPHLFDGKSGAFEKVYLRTSEVLGSGVDGSCATSTGGSS
jgi:hypothetical protein